MSKYKQLLTGANLFPEKDNLENIPDAIALWSFFLSLSWFGAAGVFITQEYQANASTIGNDLANLLLLVAIIINCSFLTRSLNSLLFAGAGMGTIGFVLALSRIEPVLKDIQLFIWPIVGEAGKQIVYAGSFLLTCLLALSLTLLCLWFQAVKSRDWGRRALLTVQVALLTLSLLFMFRPGGLSATPAGAALAVTIVSLLLSPVLLAVALWFTQQDDDKIKRKYFWAAFTIQMITAIGAVCYYAGSPAVRHLGRAVDVREVRLGDRALSRPLVEGKTVYLKIEDGRLLQVNLHAGREQTLARISLPGPAEIGYPRYSLLGGTEARLPEGNIVRKSPDELALKFVYSLWRDADQDEVNLSVEVTVNQKTGQTSWQLTGFTDRTGYRLPEPASYAGITIEPGVFYPGTNYPGYGLRVPPLVRISGAGIQTTLAPKGGVLWTYAGRDWLLAGTDQGILYIIDVGF